MKHQLTKLQLIRVSYFLSIRSYGDKSNEELLFLYGFTERSNAHDVLMVSPVGDPRDTLLQVTITGIKPLFCHLVAMRRHASRMIQSIFTLSLSVIVLSVI